ncbi:MAG: hypothetical protein AAGL89_12260 [Pseudomonadota bacterium]
MRTIAVALAMMLAPLTATPMSSPNPNPPTLWFPDERRDTLPPNCSHARMGKKKVVICQGQPADE